MALIEIMLNNQMVNVLNPQMKEKLYRLYRL